VRGGVCSVVVALALAAASAAAASPVTTSTATTAATTAAAPSYAPVAATRLQSRCASAGAAAIVVPGTSPLAVGAAPASLGASAYGAGAPVVSFEGADAAGAACHPGGISIRSLSLFDGAVTATAVSASNGKGVVSGLQVDGSAVALGPGESVPVQGWGLLVADAQVGKTLSAPLALHLLEPRAQLPAGTIVLIAFGATPAPAPAAKTKTKTKAATKTATAAKTKAATTPAAAPKQVLVPEHAKTASTAAARRAAARQKSAATHRAHRKKHKHKKHLPLRVTPPLALAHYDFPVARGADWGDTYGDNRSDIANGWHHGDDLFAPLGTPVVAVASGTLSLVGWNTIGGWRVWLEDAAGNEFYYAHLAAYSHWILRHHHVRAGQVIGFLGRTGDAFTTPPHLHFEVHPHQLFKLGYDGAVDPSSYLRTWRIVKPRKKDVPRPAKLKAPRGVPAEEAAVVWRQLLVARHLLPAPRPAAPVAAAHAFPRGAGGRAFVAPPPLRIAGAERAAARVQPPGGSGSTWVLLLLAGVAGAGTVGALVRRRLARRD